MMHIAPVYSIFGGYCCRISCLQRTCGPQLTLTDSLTTLRRQFWDHDVVVTVTVSVYLFTWSP